MSKKVKDNNYLLAKTQLGHVRPGFHELPPENHVYGKAPIKDKYGARDVITNWAQHQASSIKETGKDFVSMNRQGIKNGCKDSKDISNFRKGNQIKVKVKQGQKYYDVNIPNQDFTYGIPNRPSTPIKDVICSTYAAQQLQLKKQRQAVYAMLQKDQKKVPKVQVPLKKQDKNTQNRKKILEQNNFKLSKFKNVESKIKPIINEKKNQQ